MIYVDVNILVDVISRRDGWANSIKILNSARKKEYEFCISSITIYILHHVIDKYNLGLMENEKREKIQETIKDLILLPLDSDIVTKALESEFNDFEDAIHYETALKHNCSTIITRNELDFLKSRIQIWSPEDFYQMRM